MTAGVPATELATLHERDEPTNTFDPDEDGTCCGIKRASTCPRSMLASAYGERNISEVDVVIVAGAASGIDDDDGWEVKPTDEVDR